MTEPGTEVGVETPIARLRALVDLLERRVASIQTMIADHELNSVPDRERLHFERARDEILSGSDELEALVYRLSAKKAGLRLDGGISRLSPEG